MSLYISENCIKLTNQIDSVSLVHNTKIKRERGGDRERDREGRKEGDAEIEGERSTSYIQCFRLINLLLCLLPYFVHINRGLSL